MDVEAFVAVHESEWQELDALLGLSRPGVEEADRAVLLYQRAATHLSQVRSASPDPAIVARLDALVVRGRSRLTGVREPWWRDLARFFVVSFPAALWRIRWWTAAMTGAFLVISVGTALWIARDPQVLAAMGTPDELRRYVDNDFESYYSKNSAGSFATRVWSNNAWIAAQCVALGITGVWVPYVMLQNALGVGSAAGVMFAHDRGELFLGLILPHGQLELTCVFVAAAAGMRVFWAWVDPGPRPRSRALAEEGRALITVAMGLVVVLAVSGVVEAFVTPSGLPTPVRIGIGTLVLAAFLTYAGVLGRRATAAGETGDVRREHTGDLQSTAG